MHFVCRLFRLLDNRRKPWGDPPPDHPELRQLADDAYLRCCEWFGTPGDTDAIYSIFGCGSKHTYCAYHPLSHRYNIVLSDSRMDAFERRFAVVHEMFHRVTIRRPGLHRELWLGEALADGTAYKYLKDKGFEARCRNRVSEYLRRVDFRVTLEDLRAHKGPYGTHGAPPYPSRLVLGIAAMRAALTNILDWDGLRTAVGQPDLETWIAHFDDVKRWQLRLFLFRDLSLPWPETAGAEDLRNLGASLYMICDLVSAEKVLSEALRREPGGIPTRSRYGATLIRLSEWNKAIEFYRETIRLGLGTRLAGRNLGRCYLEAGEVECAIPHLSCAAQISDARLSALLLLAMAYIKLDDRKRAREAWRDALTTDIGGRVTREIQREIYRYPLIEELRILPRKKRSVIENVDGPGAQ